MLPSPDITRLKSGGRHEREPRGRRARPPEFSQNRILELRLQRIVSAKYCTPALPLAVR